MKLLVLLAKICSPLAYLLPFLFALFLLILNRGKTRVELAHPGKGWGSHIEGLFRPVCRTFKYAHLLRGLKGLFFKVRQAFLLCCKVFCKASDASLVLAHGKKRRVKGCGLRVQGKEIPFPCALPVRLPGPCKLLPCPRKRCFEVFPRGHPGKQASLFQKLLFGAAKGLFRFLKLGLALFPLLVRKNLYALKAAFQGCVDLVFGLCPLKGAFGDAAVDLRSRDLFENGCALVGESLQKLCKLPLGQQHGAGELLEIHASGLFDQGADSADPGLCLARGCVVLEFALRWLQFATGLFVRSYLRPAHAIAPLVRGIDDLGKTRACVACHDLVARLADFGKPRGLAVEGKANGIKERGLA